MERKWCQRPRLLKERSLSSASESCEAIATSELDDMLSIFSREAIRAILAFGDREDSLYIDYKFKGHQTGRNQTPL